MTHHKSVISKQNRKWFNLHRRRKNDDEKTYSRAFHLMLRLIARSYCGVCIRWHLAAINRTNYKRPNKKPTLMNNKKLHSKPHKQYRISSHFWAHHKCDKMWCLICFSFAFSSHCQRAARRKKTPHFIFYSRTLIWYLWLVPPLLAAEFQFQVPFEWGLIWFHSFMCRLFITSDILCRIIGLETEARFKRILQMSSIQNATETIALQGMVPNFRLQWVTHNIACVTLTWQIIWCSKHKAQIQNPHLIGRNAMKQSDR